MGRLFDDYKFLYENVSTDINIDLPMRGRLVSDRDIDLFVGKLVDILRIYGDDVMVGGRRIRKYLYDSGYRVCKCGLERIMFDGCGNAWECDGLYRSKFNRLGSISMGIDYDKLDYRWRQLDNPIELSKGCENCDIKGRCPRVKCIGDNLDVVGDMYTPDEVFCQANRAIRQSIDIYEEERCKRKN